LHLAVVDFRWSGHHTPYAANIIELLLENEHKVTFVTSGEHNFIDSFADDPSLNIIKVDSPEFIDKFFSIGNIDEIARSAYQLNRCFKQLSGINFDALHFLTIDYLSIPLVLNSTSQIDQPVVGTLHRDRQFDPASIESDFKRSLATIHYSVSKRCFRRILGSLVDEFITHSESMKERVVDNFQATESQVHTLRLPSSNIDDTESEASPRRQAGLPSAKPIILFFGELRHEKGPDILIDSLTNFDIPTTLVFAGEPVDYSQETISRWQRELPQNIDIVDELTYVPESKLTLYFQSADVLVLPYRRRIGTSGLINFACATETHVIGPKNTDVGYHIQKFKLGDVFEYKDPESLRMSLYSLLESEEEFKNGRTIFLTIMEK